MNATSRAVEARDLAREALSDVADQVGDYIQVLEDGEGLVTHCFDCSNPGYVGWYWAVTLVTLDGHTTVSEANLLPGAGAVVPPPWRPEVNRETVARHRGDR